MTYPPQPGGYDPYGHQSGYSPQQPVTSVPSSPAGGYGPPGYGPPGYGQPGYGAPPPYGYGGGVSTPQPGDRPGVVTAAAMLMVAMTVISLLLGGLGFVTALQEDGSSAASSTYECDPAVYDCSAYDEASASAEEAAATGKMVGIIFAVVYLIAGLGIIGLALAILRGHNWARITTWSLYGLFGACGLCGVLVSLGVLSGMTDGAETGGGVIFVLGSLIALVVEVVTVVLLATPTANQWFREIGAAKRAGVL